MTIIERIIQHILNHPIHPLIVHFPIALSGAALFFILLALWKKSKILEQVAFANIALAAVSTLVAEVIGMVDNRINYGGNAPNYQWKIVFASLLLVVTALLSITRWRNPDLMYRKSTKIYYIAAYFVAFAICGILGILGSIIMYGGF